MGEESPSQEQIPHAYSSDHFSDLRFIPSLDLHCRPPLPLPLQRCIVTLPGDSSHVSSLLVNGGSLYSGSSNGKIRSWRLKGSFSENGIIVAASRSGVKSMVVAGNRLFTAHHDHKILVWRIAARFGRRYRLSSTLPTNYVEVRRHRRTTWVNHADAVSSVAFSDDGAVLYSVSWDRTLKVWRVADGRCLESVAGAHQDAINSVTAAADGAVYTGSADGTINVWRRCRGEKKHSLAATLERHKSAVNALALSPDGRVLYSGAGDRSVVVWETGGGASSSGIAVAGALRGHSGAVLCLAAMAELVCSGSADMTARVWWRKGAAEYSCLAVLRGHRGPVKCVAAATAEQDENAAAVGGGVCHAIYTGSLDGDIKVWRVCAP
ncbi:unnamed protein product [Spirodela intermedia]|uniref:Uncharacterized protein n=1 Tax=Spirodela intermedia TaxID=51605 RepID=A0A7I8JKD7_SPIIN|nr:unnamed protein product [Spirodela intermedia]CAA6670053.1 unnamed protein product [Spirodela intermedia]